MVIQHDVHRTRDLVKVGQRLTHAHHHHIADNAIALWITAQRATATGDLLDLPFGPQSFDVVVAVRLLPHDLPPWEAVYQQSRRWLAAGVFDAMVDDLLDLSRIDAERMTLESTPISPEATPASPPG